MQRALEYILHRFIAQGGLTVRWPNGSSATYGPGGEPSASLVLRDQQAVRRMLTDPALALGELYMEGRLEPDGCDLYDVLAVLMTNAARDGGRNIILSLRQTVRRIARPLLQINGQRRARRNVAHHYDLNSELYSLFLDEDWQYSCAYFPTGRETLEAAQAAKKRHIAAKLLLDRPGLSVVDIGCGWGGLALTLARDYGAEVLGITLSEEQLVAARARADGAGLSHRVRFELLDYRNLSGEFDRVVSVGMFEHVGMPNYPKFFRTIREVLRPDGVALLHTIGNSHPPAATNTWLTKYIFPGGYSPSLSEVMPAIEQSGLIATDIEVLRLHYAKTIHIWRDRFSRNRDTIRGLYDERFCRMFEFYLTCCELTFKIWGEVNFQVQLARELTALPITRDYMVEAERERQAAE